MSGQVRRFNLTDNTLGDKLEQKVTVHYTNFPIKKSSNGKIVCL